MGFTVPLAAWFRGALREDVLRLADSPYLADSGAVDVGMVRKMARAHAGGAADHSKALWLVWVFNAFLRHRAAVA
jgi:asparagine synthase (glutamine-hydrolysing)